MVIIFVRKNILILLVNIFFMRGYATNDGRNEYLLFENFLEEKMLPVDFSAINGYIITDSVFFNEKLLLYPRNESKITGCMFDFLCDIDLINNKNSYEDIDDNNRSKSYDKFLESRKNNLKLYNVGRIIISKEFESFIILSIDGDDNEYNWVRNLYLINVKNQKCKSLTRISCYACFDGECLCLYTERKANNLFVLKDEDINCNLSIVDEIQKNSSIVKFMYDKKGMVKILK
ncbi:hypothetical protein [Parabacteroides faecis]|uniref:hypothetical protein n=1 Tax=Parabacteroides faecis TaxID=1217282 RepID=UPI0035206916